MLPGADKSCSCRTAVFTRPNDPEFQTFPPHCVEGTEGAKFVPEALTENSVFAPTMNPAGLPDDFSRYQQIHLHKQTLDIFESRHARSLVDRLPLTRKSLSSV